MKVSQFGFDEPIIGVDLRTPSPSPCHAVRVMEIEQEGRQCEYKVLFLCTGELIEGSVYPQTNVQYGFSITFRDQWNRWRSRLEDNSLRKPCLGCIEKLMLNE